jgi:hypothetical protein
MMPRAFEEAPAGLAALSLALHGGLRCRPPIPRMGNKAGYVHALLDLAGLRPGEGAGAYVWSEADADVRGLLRAYPDPAMLLRIAEIIRGWADEEPRALWERLRAERKTRGPATDPDLAGWIISSMWSYEQGNVRTGFCGPGARRQDTSAADAAACNNLATYAQVVASNRLINVAGLDLTNTGKGGTTFGGEAFAMPAAKVATGFAILGQWAFRRGEPDSGFNAGVETGAAWNADAAETADRCQGLASRWPPVLVLPHILPAAELADALGTPGDLDGVVCYMDPPYVGTTGYGADLPRAEVVAHALARADLGALVMVSEAEPIPELVAAGWYATRIDHARKGHKRTFSKQQAEWVTTNREPVHKPPAQAGLFRGAL